MQIKVLEERALDEFDRLAIVLVDDPAINPGQAVFASGHEMAAHAKSACLTFQVACASAVWTVESWSLDRQPVARRAHIDYVGCHAAHKIRRAFVTGRENPAARADSGSVANAAGLDGDGKQCGHHGFGARGFFSDGHRISSGVVRKLNSSVRPFDLC